jgi:hypothetical protein
VNWKWSGWLGRFAVGSIGVLTVSHALDFVGLSEPWWSVIDMSLWLAMAFVVVWYEIKHSLMGNSRLPKFARDLFGGAVRSWEENATA